MMVGVAGFEPATPTSRTSDRSQTAVILLEGRRKLPANVPDRFTRRHTGSLPVAAPPLPLTGGGRTVAALYVQADGAYANLPGVDLWPIERDARTYAGPHPVVAHPPCERWGRMWFGSPRKPDPEKYRFGDDGGCFEAALAAVRRWGGVLEHPADSGAWRVFGLNRPDRGGGWIDADSEGGWTCYVEQGHYGHAGRKGTWLYAHGVDPPELKWGSSGQRLCPIMLERHGYEKARRCGITGRIGVKAKKEHRAATPPAFRDLLLSIAITGGGHG